MQKEISHYLNKSSLIVVGSAIVSASLTIVDGIQDRSVHVFEYFVGYLFGHFIASFLMVCVLTLIITFIQFLFFCFLSKKERFSDWYHIVGFILSIFVVICYKLYEKI